MSRAFDLQAIVRPNIWTLVPYRCARDDYDSGILLDANENSLGSVYPDEGDLHRYPCPYQRELKRRIADYRGVNADMVFVGVGSDEAIDILIRIFCKPAHDNVIITPPTYGMYKVAANINDVEVVNVPLTEDFQLRPKEVLAAASERTKIIFVCSPNNPTANVVRLDDIKALLDSSYRGIVIVDEAYIDFADHASVCKLVFEYPQLVVLQTLSKAFGLAGIRLGMAIAHPDIIAIMSKVKAPYNVSKLTSKAALRAFESLPRLQEKIAVIKSERARLVSLLRAIPQVGKIHPSDANFVLFEVPNSYKVYKNVAAQGVILRYRGDQIHCDNCIRATVGTPQENDALIAALKKSVAEECPAH